MGVARDLERRLEGVMEGFFAKVFRSGLQPVEIGRRIVREMEEGRTVSVNRVYAPNEFQVHIGPDDHTRFAPMEPGLVREFSDVVIDAAKKNRWNLMGMPRISFHEDPSYGKGEFRVEASLAADPDRPQEPRASTRQPNEDDLSMTRAVSSSTAERLGLQSAGAELIVVGPSGDEKDRISITRAPATIGRLSNNDVVLSDSNVSRRHAELRQDGGRWMLVDLGSTNGTLVNGKVAREHALEDGDRVTFGTSEMVFRTRGAR